MASTQEHESFKSPQDTDGEMRNGSKMKMSLFMKMRRRNKKRKDMVMKGRRNKKRKEGVSGGW
ncbi:MAG: hypothetical protein LBT40_00730 [Deltaproteobacteria bacterium]|nr:hypothetical protein [Deltaproteobacteria bacterium]